MEKRQDDAKRGKKKESENKKKDTKKTDPVKKKNIASVSDESEVKKLYFFLEKITGNMFFVPVMTLLCFAIMCATCYLNDYRIFDSDFSVNGLFHCLYVGDFSIGLTSRVLIGSILSLFTDNITRQAINIFAKVFLYISFLIQSVITSFVIRKGFSEKNIFMLLLSLIFILSPVTICTYTYYFGVLDLYNYVVFLIALAVLIKGKGSLQFSVCAFSVLGLLIHYSFFLAFFPALFVIGLLRTVNSSGKELKKEAVALGLNSVLSVGGFFYLSVLAKNHLRMNADEMIEYVYSKVNSKNVFIYDDYLKYYIFDIFKGEQMPDTGSSLSELIKINVTLAKPGIHLKYLLYLSVVLIIFWWICGALVRREKGKGKLPFIAACIMPLQIIPELILSSDVGRWIASTMLCMFMVLFAFYLMEVPSFKEFFADVKKKKLPIKLSVVAVLIVYLCVGFFFDRILYG